MFGTLELSWNVTGSINIMTDWGIATAYYYYCVEQLSSYSKQIIIPSHPDYWYLNQIHHIQEIASGLRVFPLCNFLGEIFFNCLEFSFLFDCRLYRVACAPISNEIISQKAETRHNQPLTALYLPLVGVFVSATLAETQKDL